HRLPAAEGAQPPFQHPIGLALLGGNVANRVFAQPLGRALHLDIGDEAVFVLFAQRGDLFAGFGSDAHAASLWSLGFLALRSRSFTKDATAAVTSSMVEDQPKLARKAQAARPCSTPMAVSTWLNATLPEEQVEPELILTPSRSSPISAVSAVRPGMAKQEVL